MNCGLVFVKHLFLVTLIWVIYLFLSGCGTSEPTVSPPAPTAPLANQSPSISTIIAPQEVLPSSASDIQSIASDPDNDPITYIWTVSGGQIEGSDSIVKWTAPETSGDYVIEVKVSDGAGGEDHKSVTIKVGVKPNTAPMLSFKVTNENQVEIIVLPNDTEPINVAQWKTLKIECIAEDAEGDGINFLWAASDGKIESIDGKNNPVKFIATTRGDCMVVCTAVDSRGARSQATIYFFIPCCGQGGFGKSGM